MISLLLMVGTALGVVNRVLKERPQGCSDPQDYGELLRVIVGGVIGNKADDLVSYATRSSWNFFKNLRTQDPALNHDLERSTREAYLLATVELIRQAKLWMRVGTSGSRLMTAGTGESLAVLQKAVEEDLQDVHNTLPDPLTDVQLFLIDPALAPAERMNKLRETLRRNLERDFSRWLPGMEVPAIVGKLLEEGWTISTPVHKNVPRDWYSLVAIAFVEKLKTTPRLATVFESKLLAQIAMREPAAAPIATFTGFTQSLDAITVPLQRMEDTLHIVSRDITEIKTDVKDIKQAVSFLGSGRRLIWASAGVLVAAVLALFAGAALVNRAAGSSPAAPGNTWMEDAAREAGIDLNRLTAEDFTVIVKSSVTTGDNNAMLDIRVPAALDAITSRGALEYRVGSRPWKPSFINPVSGELIAMLDTRDMEAKGPVQLRLDRNPGTLSGPFIGPFEYKIDVQSELQRGERTLATSDSTWLKSVGATWSVDSQFIERTADVVRAVKVGPTRDKLTLRVELPRRPRAGASPQDLVNYGIQTNSMLLKDVLSFGIRDTLYGQVEFFDGTLGPVVEFKAVGRTAPTVESYLAAMAPTPGGGYAVNPAIPGRNVSRPEIQGAWDFRPATQPGSAPVITLTFTTTSTSGSQTSITIVGDGISGKGQLTGTYGTLQVSGSAGGSTNGTLTFDSSGILQLYLQANPYTAGQLPSGLLHGRRK